jgi:hypothetical protein
MHTKIFSFAISILFIFLTSCSEPNETEKALSYLKDSIVDLLLASNYNRFSNLINDNNIVTDSFLFEHSTWAIEQWDSPWGRHLSFDEFCKFLLSYRIDKEPFEDWKQVLSSNFPWLIRLNKDSLSAFDAVCQINGYFGDVDPSFR